jgi:fructose-1,6-bisphosphatase/inositol monophosphatase family enzyme
LAAGTLLVAEAGGQCSDMKGGAHAMTSPHLLTDNGAIHQETLELFGEIFRGQFRVPIPAI